MNIVMSMELYNEKTCCSAFSCHDLETVNGLIKSKVVELDS